MDRRCSDRDIELTDGPDVTETKDGHELRIGWRVTYKYGNALKMVLPGRSAVNISDGVIAEMRDEYSDEELGDVSAWMQEYGSRL